MNKGIKRKGFTGIQIIIIVMLIGVIGAVSYTLITNNSNKTDKKEETTSLERDNNVKRRDKDIRDERIDIENRIKEDIVENIKIVDNIAPIISDRILPKFKPVISLNKVSNNKQA